MSIDNKKSVAILVAGIVIPILIIYEPPYFELVLLTIILLLFSGPMAKVVNELNFDRMKQKMKKQLSQSLHTDVNDAFIAYQLLREEE